MADHPSTSGGETLKTGETAWSDRAALHAKDSGGGVLHGGKALGRGTFAEMIRHIAMLPEEERAGYVIEKAGDRQYSADEAMALASHPDFPAQGEA
ncbi:hypothetical protein [Porphyrobacter sp. AAP60]|uniref:hypothetical protein n=1 Tax=Porphyrobacter sp. AAP60 TaxID=1523423 RepID=UPI0006B9042C|nr:hypothetical protein [Porphyrobacter sp. AAP60]KPF65315.1 hypothetical protein IP79_03945 [Porphyrobacter sp. AAP60]